MNVTKGEMKFLRATLADAIVAASILRYGIDGPAWDEDSERVLLAINENAASVMGNRLLVDRDSARKAFAGALRILAEEVERP